MFFAPPAVKSLSKYSEFGAHLGAGTFGIMLLVALFVHASLIGIYTLQPHARVMKIPVRVLNINLGSNISETAPAEEQPRIDQLRVSSNPKVESDEDEPDVKPSAQSEFEKAIAGKNVTPKETPGTIHLPPAKKTKDQGKIDAAAKKDASTAIGLSMPKKYVRELAGDSTKKTEGPAAGGPAKPEEIVQRYEQAISLWISQRKVYPEEAKQRHAEGDAVVRVRINRQGHILYYVIEKSSGDAFIDHAVMSMVRASDPAPPVPENYPEGDEFEFLVPVSFKLQ